MNESEIPIDIHTGKLQDWLVSRRIVPKDIQPYIKDVRNKITNALKDMPANDELIELLSGTHINYFHCKRIIEILKQTEKDTKTLFGSYGSQRMKDWQEIIKVYEKQNVYLGEAAQILVRNLTYEIPVIRKQMIKCEQQSDDSLKRVQDLRKTETILLNEHNVLCQQIGIKGENLKSELTEKLKDLPALYSESISNISDLRESVDLYNEFSKDSTCFPIIRHLIEFGNTTIYQYINKEAPLTIQENPIKLNLSDDEKQTQSGKIGDNEIDFGIDDNSSPESNSAEIIDFGDLNAAETQLETGDIDWGETIETAPSNKVEIDFDVSLDEYGIIVESVGMDGGIAKGEQAYTILDSPNFREKFIDELYELKSFLRLRHYELNALETSENFMFSLMGNMSTHDIKSIDKMLIIIEKIIVKVQNEQTQHLFQLKHSSKYAELLASKLRQKLSAVEKNKLTQEILKVKAVDLIKEKENLKPVSQKLIEKTKVLQDEIEKDISKRYKNRPVNLMAGIQSLL